MARIRFALFFLTVFASIQCSDGSNLEINDRKTKNEINNDSIQKGLSDFEVQQVHLKSSDENTSFIRHGRMAIEKSEISSSIERYYVDRNLQSELFLGIGGMTLALATYIWMYVQVNTPFPSSMPSQAPSKAPSAPVASLAPSQQPTVFDRIIPVGLYQAGSFVLFILYAMTLFVVFP